MAQENSVSLSIVFEWICPVCGEWRYAEPYSKDMPLSELEAEFRSHNSLSDWDELPEGWECFKVINYPVAVICEKCNQKYIVSNNEDA